ncbi:MAG: substrate-binding domain-containing protein [Candidatus Dormibacteria bacterium]
MVGLALVLALVVGFRGHGGSSAAGARTASAAGAGGGVPRSDCVGVTVAASPEKSDLLARLAARYDANRPSLDGHCVDVRVNAVLSGVAEKALAAGWDASKDGPNPVVWSPAASSWLGILSHDTAGHDRGDPAPLVAPQLIQSPLVLAMPRPMAEALGWPHAAIGWADVLRLAQDPRGWGAYGHPQWGRFRLGKTSPVGSTAGLFALLDTYYAATGVRADLTTSDVNDPRVQDFVRAVESSVLHYSGQVSTFLDGLRAADAHGAGLSYVSAIATEEQQVLRYDAARPATPLVAVYPSDGTLVADHPYATLTESWVSPDQRRAAATFLGWLLQPDQQQPFVAAGFRDHNGQASPTLSTADGIIPAGPPVVLKLPAPAVLDEVRTSWNSLRKRARILVVLDVSGSMQGDKIDNVRRAAATAVKAFAPDDEVGLWSFSSDVNHLDGIAPVASNGTALTTDIGTLQADGATALYRVTKEAVAEVRKGWDAERINAVMLMTDGQNEDSNNNDLGALLDALRRQPVERPVPVFTIGYGTDADLDTLRRISEATHGRSYNAPDPSRVEAVFADVVSNF